MESKIRTRTQIPIKGGITEFVTFYGLCDGKEHVAIGFGDYASQSVPLVRIHSECLTGDIFGSERCDCGSQLNEAIDILQEEGGVLLYLRQEGRGIGLYNKIDTYLLQSNGFDTYAANEALGFRKDCREYFVAAQMLFALGIRSIQLISNNPDKSKQLESNGIKVRKQISTGVYLTQDNRNYLRAKVLQTQHSIDLRKTAI